MLALTGLVLLLLGAITSRIKVHDPVQMLLLDVVVLAPAIATVVLQLAR